MFDGLSGLDWMFVGAALAFGFGVVKFVLVIKGSQKSAVPSVWATSEGQASTASAVGRMGVEPVMSADCRRDLPRIDEAEAETSPDRIGEKVTTGAAWFELLGVPRTASGTEIEEAFERKWGQFAPDRLTNLMTDLHFIANGGLEPSMPKQLEVQSMKAAVLAEQLESMLGRFLHEIEAAREEGLRRRRQGRMD